MKSSERYRIAAKCPCGKSNRDGKYNPKTGKCFSCGEVIKDDDQPTHPQKQMSQIERQFPPVEVFDISTHGKFLKHHLSTWLIEHAPDQDTAHSVINAYHLGSTDPETALFWYLTADGKPATAKQVAYGPDGKRDKERSPYYHYKRDEGYWGEFFGLHLLKEQPGKPVVLVESEKSALLAAMWAPEYVWLATGGGMKPNTAKMRLLSGREVYILPDADHMREHAQQLEQQMTEQGIVCRIVDPFPDRTDGYDIADHLVDGFEYIIETETGDQKPFFVEKWFEKHLPIPFSNGEINIETGELTFADEADDDDLHPLEHSQAEQRAIAKEKAEQLRDRFMMIGDDYFEFYEHPLPNGKGSIVRRQTVKVHTLSKRYGKGVREELIAIMPYYHREVFVPIHTPDFERKIGTCYNAYHPLEHVPEPGPIDNTLKFVRHIFAGEKDGLIDADQFELGLDYLQLLFAKPETNLPILCLVSEEQQTGKTTFLDWLCAIYGHNAIKARADDIGERFNASWEGKLLIMFDEGGIDKIKTREFLKSQSTSPTISIEGKGKEQREAPFFGKFLFTSNHPTKFLNLEPGETRFWVRPIPQHSSTDPYFAQKLRAEIPAFLHFLQNRTLSVPEKLSRMWFAPAQYDTKALQRVKDYARPKNIRKLDLALRDFMEQVYPQYHDYAVEQGHPYVMALDANDVADLLARPNAAGQKLSNAEEREYVNAQFKTWYKFEKSGQKRRPWFKPAYDESEDRLTYQQASKTKKIRAWMVPLDKFFSEEEIKELITQVENENKAPF